MADYTILDLSTSTSWEPSLALLDTSPWPEPAPTHRLGDLVTRIAPVSMCDAGAAVITPANIDQGRGGVLRRSRKYQGAVYQVGSELHAGDLLVARNASTPALMVTDHLAGALVSSSFIALRPTSTAPTVWLWALLSSRTGHQIRRLHALNHPAMLLHPADLLDIAVPVPSMVRLAEVTPSLLEIAATTQAPEVEAVETWWRTTDLRHHEWRQMLSSPRPEVLDEGDPLSTYCREIVKGRTLRDQSTERQESGSFPVVNISMLRTGTAGRWAGQGATPLTQVHPGDLCVAAVGERFYATVLPVDAAADPNVFVLRLHSPELGPALAHYLNGEKGLALRRMLLSGTSVPSLSRASLEKLPVPAEALQRIEQPRPTGPLANRLEEALCSS